MITLPHYAVPGSMQPAFIDYGIFQRGAAGGPTRRVDVPGGRYRVGFTYGPYTMERGAALITRLIAGKQEGVEVALPLLRSQGLPGSPVVDGAGQSGKTLDIRGLNAGYICKEGYWLSISNAAGRRYLHNVKTGGTADGSGLLTVTLNEGLRHAFADGAVINLAKPTIQGFVEGQEWQWQIAADRLVPIEFAIEEYE